MKLVIDGKVKISFVTTNTKKPTTINTCALQCWSLESSMFTAWLIHTMEAFIGKTYLFLPTAKKMNGKPFVKHVLGKGSTHIFELKIQL